MCHRIPSSCCSCCCFWSFYIASCQRYPHDAITFFRQPFNLTARCNVAANDIMPRLKLIVQSQKKEYVFIWNEGKISFNVDVCANNLAPFYIGMWFHCSISIFQPKKENEIAEIRSICVACRFILFLSSIWFYRKFTRTLS